MMVDLAPGWKTELDRGPDWLFVKLHGPYGKVADATGMAESLCLLMQQDFVRRVVLELDGLSELPQDFVGELLTLGDLVDREGGVVRVCGLRSDHQQSLRQRDRAQRFVPFRSREEAVLGFYRPNRPR